jgi:hypothetical protein
MKADTFTAFLRFIAFSCLRSAIIQRHVDVSQFVRTLFVVRPYLGFGINIFFTNLIRI